MNKETRKMPKGAIERAALGGEMRVLDQLPLKTERRNGYAVFLQDEDGEWEQQPKDWFVEGQYRNGRFKPKLPSDKPEDYLFYLYLSPKGYLENRTKIKKAFLKDNPDRGEIRFNNYENRMGQFFDTVIENAQTTVRKKRNEIKEVLAFVNEFKKALKKG